MRRPHGEDRQVLGGAGGLLDVRGGDGSFCRQLRFEEVETMERAPGAGLRGRVGERRKECISVQQTPFSCKVCLDTGIQRPVSHPALGLLGDWL